MALRKLVTFLLPTNVRFFQLVEAQAGLLLRTAENLATALAEGEPVTAALAEVAESDAAVLALDAELAATFVTPIDRDDLHRLASELHRGILQVAAAREAASALGAEQPVLVDAMKTLAAHLARQASAIVEIMPRLRTKDHAAIVEARRSMRVIDREANTAYRMALARLVEESERDARELLRDKAILDYLDRAVEQCSVIGVVLARIGVKNG